MLVVDPELDIDITLHIRQIWASLRGLGFDIEWVNGTANFPETCERPIIVVSDCFQYTNDKRVLQLVHVDGLLGIELLANEQRVYAFKDCDELRDLLIYLYDYDLNKFIVEMGK